ncbi:ATP phosphoribosyltransferase regulatory subunit [Alkalihalobacillus sp. AL-G]|uniref:ATP phosphoribosyltransferase regulatory subunit n=1 Tax=Alkalihalobacillus sp. AL-G TaxID=2926399 RepID=UPI00272CD56C|nr:ATP phosphoribosyltransferase regulatory subunit [Alkalihalobacillus sp. AL-G]WLD92927.1 ATP phosphoribosyltransferase regulatory subunit [Alkalihalobacillus sp. AL-G]
MSKPLVFEKPLGMRDTLPDLYEIKSDVRSIMEQVVRHWGYRFMQTPTVEYYDTVGEASATLEQQLFKLLDQEGKTLVLRPDMTAPIARVAASSLKDEPLPMRLAYAANVFRAQQQEGGRPAEFEQFGVELIGDGTVSGDGEVIALMIETLQHAGLNDFQVAVGHVGYVDALFMEILGNGERVEQLKRYLYEKNYVGYRQHVKQLPLSSIDQQRLLQFLQLRGDASILEHAEALISSTPGYEAIEELHQLRKLLKAYGATDVVLLDLTLVSHMTYYTGVVFEGYAQELGFPISNGGRYDTLLSRFNVEAQATGFGIHLDSLLEALQPQENNGFVHCVIFTEENRDEAIAFSVDKRKCGERVVLQDLKGITDIDAFTGTFSSVTYLIGKRKEEGNDD